MKANWINEQLGSFILEEHLLMVCPFTDCNFTIGINTNIETTKSQMVEHICSHEIKEIDFMDEDEIDKLSSEYCEECNTEYIELEDEKCKCEE